MDLKKFLNINYLSRSNLFENQNEGLEFCHSSPQLDIDVKQQLVYEGFISLDAIAFYIGVNNSSNTEIDKLGNAVIKAKNTLFKDKGFINYFSDFESSPPTNKYDDLLKYRKEILSNDQSSIFKNLIINTQLNIVKKAKMLSKSVINKKSAIFHKDNEYKNMLLRIRDYIINGDNLFKMLDIEKKEFYKPKINIPLKSKEDLIYSLSLGAYIIRIPKLYEVVNHLVSEKKEALVSNWVKEIMSSVEEIYNKTKNKNSVETKIFLKEFLSSFLYRKTHIYDNLLERKANIYKSYFKSYSDLADENVQQENEISKMIKLVDLISDEKIKVIYSPSLVDKYTKYLLKNNNQSKEDLLNLFKH